MSLPCQNTTDTQCDDYPEDSGQRGLELWAWLLIGFGVFIALGLGAALSVYLARRHCTDAARRRSKLRAESAVSSLAGDHPHQCQQSGPSASSSPGPLANSGASFDSFNINNPDPGADQDWFLHSLESAVFASSSAMTIGPSNGTAAASLPSDCRLCVLSPASLPYYSR